MKTLKLGVFFLALATSIISCSGNSSQTKESTSDTDSVASLESARPAEQAPVTTKKDSI